MGLTKLNLVREMPISEFVENLWHSGDGRMSYLHSEFYFGREYNAETYLRHVNEWANEDGIVLTELSRFDYDAEFWEYYNTDEDKGLQ